MKIPFLSAKAEKAVNKVVDIAGEKIQKTMNSGVEDKLQTVAVILPIIATALVLYSGVKHSSPSKTDMLPYKVVINNYYYYGTAKEGL